MIKIPFASRERERSNWIAAATLSSKETAAFPNRLKDPRPVRFELKSATVVLLLLLFVTALPRVLIALRVPTVCVDGTGYIALAESFERGEANLASIYRFNPYPPILAVLHRAGLDWETAGKVWGVLCGTLVVLPLFGWVRRQFDDRIAVISCLLYAWHPELIKWSPEVVRDQTFWLLFATCLYLLWRTVTELRYRHFALLGFALPLCACSRFEGVFLLIPFASWVVTRFRALEVGRARLVSGLALSCAAPLAPLLLANAVWLKQDSLGKLPYVEPLNRLQAWVGKLTGEHGAAPSQPAAAAAAATATVKAKPISWRLTWKLLHVLERGLEPFFGTLLLVGLFSSYFIFLRSDHGPTVLLGLAVIGGILIHLWSVDSASSRYSLSIVIMGSRCATVGLLRFNHLMVELLKRLGEGAAQLAPQALAANFILLACVGSFSIISTSYDTRIAKANLGQWICRAYGEHCVVAGSDDQLELVGYYAHAVTRQFDLHTPTDPIVAQIDRVRPDVLVVSNPPPRELGSILSDRETLGLQRIEPEYDLKNTLPMMVFHRQASAKSPSEQAALTVDRRR